jgi:hypothetical protein
VLNGADTKPYFASAGVMYGVSLEDILHFDEQVCGGIEGACVCVCVCARMRIFVCVCVC